MKPRYLWLIANETGAATHVRVKRLWRWRGPACERHGVSVQTGHVTRVVVDYCGTELRLSLWQGSDRWRLSTYFPEGCR
jgi:hypothetical protein